MARILIVEDDPIHLRKGVELLTQFGHHPLTAASGQEAAQVIRASLPDAILLDVVLPDTDGFEFARLLQKHPRTRDIPIAFITSCDEFADFRNGFDSGGVAYLTKPYSSSAFSTVLAAIV